MATSALICLSFFLLFSCATCFNITKMLEAHPDFSTFNQYLTQTKLAAEINKRQTITVLAVANDQMGSVSAADQEALHRVMSLHVVLDYYDDAKLSKLPKNTALLTTLFQSSGVATNQLGFLNVTKGKDGVVFGSATTDAPLDSKLVGKVVAQPYNISVLQISAPIVPQDIATSDPAAPKKAPVASPKKAPVASPKKAPAKEDPESPAEEPTASEPPAAEPASDAPGSPPAPAPDADGPVADADADAPDAKENSSGTRATVGLVMVAISAWIAL